MGNRALFLCFSHQLDTFLQYHIDKLEKEGFSVDTIILDRGDYMRMSRRGFWDIFIKILQVTKHVRRLCPNLIITITPKIGFVVSLSLLFNNENVKHIHWFTGQVWANNTGILRVIKKLPDKVTYRLSSCILCDSISQKKYLESHGFSKGKIVVLGRGSICGVDDSLFQIEIKNSASPNIKVGIVGRICRDKGIFWLLDVISRRSFSSSLEFHLYGEMDLRKKERILFEKTVNDLNGTVIYHPREDDKKAIYSNLDIVLSPSFREGFSNVLAEAQAAGLPVIARAIYGVESTIIEGKTGFLFDSEQDLFSRLNNLSLDQGARHLLSEHGRQFSYDNFRRDHVVQGIFDFYTGVLDKC